MTDVEIIESVVQQLWRSPLPISQLNHVAADAQIDSPIKQGLGPTALIEAIQYWRQAFPDNQSHWLSCDEIEPGTFKIHWQAKGTHIGTEFFGIAANGKSVEYQGETIYVVRDDQIVSYQANVDIETIKLQLQ